MENSVTNSNVSILPLPLMLSGQTHQKSGEHEGEIPENSRQCPICHAYYKYGNSYWQHVRYVHASFLIQCVICEKCYKRTTMAKHHILHSHKIAWHLCGNYIRRIKKSDLSLRPKNSLEKKNANLKYFRKRTLHLITCFNCYNCPESFSSIQELFQHVKSHKGQFFYDDDLDSEEEENKGEEKHEESKISNEEEQSKISNGEEQSKISNGEEQSKISNGEEMSEAPNGEEMSEIPNGEEMSEIPKGEEMSEIPNGEDESKILNEEEKDENNYEIPPAEDLDKDMSESKETYEPENKMDQDAQEEVEKILENEEEEVKGFSDCQQT